MNPHRSAIDHILTVVGAAPAADLLVLRGSVTMLAWAGPRAREPGDLDWVVRPIAVRPQGRSWPYPYVDAPHRVRSAPETAHRRSRDELWAPEEFETEGRRVRLPPEGLHWMRADDIDAGRPHEDVLDLLRANPLTPEGLRLDPDAAVFDAAFGYPRDPDDDEIDEYQGRGVRLRVPFDGGSVQLDFAYDEVLPEPPVLTAIPRADGGLNALWTASPGLSLAWKLQWLVTDQATRGAGGGKDLYDAVLLAERPGPVLSRRLRRLPGLSGLEPVAVRGWTVTGHPALHGGVPVWLDRLEAALTPLLQPFGR